MNEKYGASVRTLHGSYAMLIAYLTFDFLALRAFREAPLASLHRVLMIAAGALLAVLVSLVPTPQSSAGEQARGMLAEALADSADGLLAVVRAHASGRRLHRLESIDRDLSADDEVHSKYAAVIVSRAPFEEAVKSAGWEACWLPRALRGGSRSAVDGEELAALRDLGRSVRRLAYTVFSLDAFLRAQPRRPPVPPTPDAHARPPPEDALLATLDEVGHALHLHASDGVVHRLPWPLP